MATLQLNPDGYFARGGNRLCFVHPTDPDRCIKVLRPDRDLAFRRRRKGWKGRLKPASYFDENSAEAETLEDLHTRHGPALGAHVPYFLGWIDTNLGRGLTTNLVRDADGRISRSLKQIVWEDGWSDELTAAVGKFAEFWISHAVASRDLLLHNIVCRANPGSLELLVIDGLGSSDWLPLARWSKTLARRKSARKIDNMRLRINRLLETRQADGDPGVHGFLTPSARRAPFAHAGIRPLNEES